MNILVLTRYFPCSEREKKSNNTKVVSAFVKKWTGFGHRVLVIVNSSVFPRAYYPVAGIFRNRVFKHYDITRFPELFWNKDFSYTEDGASVYNLPMIKYYPSSPYTNAKYRKQLCRILSVLEKNCFIPDIITGHWVNPQLKLISMLKPYFPKAKTALVFHSDYTQDKIKKYKVEQYLEDIDHVGFRSFPAALEAKKYLNLKDRSFVCLSGIPDEYIEESYNCEKNFEGKFRIVFAGRLLKLKNIDKTILAAIESFGYDFDMTIAGEGPYSQDLLDLIKAYNAQDRVNLIGKVSREMVQDIMKKSHIFALISKETFGLVYLEAMLQGCIVIASKNCGVDGIIKNGYNGFLCEQGDKEELEKIFREIKNLPKDDLRRISCSAVETARNLSESSAARNYLLEIQV